MKHRISALSCSLALLLAGCAEPQPVFKPVTVEVPVATPCKAPDIPKPDFALAHVTPTDGLFNKVKASLVEIDQRKAYEAPLVAAAGACE